ncbi:MAG TPA: protein kinase [Vicinamibacteria bacterium]
MLEGPDWERLDALLDAALGVPPEERPRWLEEACGADLSLRARLETLIGLAESEKGALQPGGAQSGPLWEEVVDELERVEDAPLAPGDRVGPYEVVSLLGSGGMGRVYRARDARLGREVAIKALAAAFLGREASLRRFEREARTLAALSHPNIAAIHEVLSVGDSPYLVLELVEGPTLADRLERGALRVEEALGIGVQIAEALEEAHRRGVVHRDLKPSNVKLDPAGRVKVLDFGLATTEPESGDADLTRTAGATLPGAILGTAPYMSPEQARGRDVDRRADIWSFGCLLYEMLTGVRAFAGENLSDVLAAVLRDEPDLGRLPSALPPSVRRLLERCLRKDPRRRVQDMGDVRLELQEPEAGAPAASPRPSSRLPWAVAAAALVAAGVAGAALLRARAGPPAVAARPRHLQLEPGGDVSVARDYATSFAIAPDGSAVVFVGARAGTTRLYLRPLDRPEIKALPGTEDAWQPFFSPDGRFVAFFADRKLHKAPVAGGPAVTLAEIGNNPRGASWGPAGDIVLAPTQTSGLALVSDQGGPLRELTRLDATRGERAHRWPQFLPGGAAVLFNTAGEDGTFDDALIEVVDVVSGARRVLHAGGAHPRYAPSGHLVFARTPGLYAVPFDAGRRVAHGEARLVLEGVAYSARNGGTQMALAEEGTLVYVPARPAPLERHLGWLRPGGAVDPISGEARRFREPRLSPDGGRIAVIVTGDDGSDAWLLDVASRTPARLTFGRVAHRPVWTPDGRAVTLGLVEARRWRLATVEADGGRLGPALVESANRLYPCAWSRDGRRLVYQERRPDSGWDLMVLPVGVDGRPEGAPEALAASQANEENGTPSPDGAWVAFDSDEVDGVAQVYVAPLGRPGDTLRVTIDGGRDPRWSAAGHLYYWNTRVFEVRRLEGRPSRGRWTATSEAPALPSEGEAPDGSGLRFASSPEANVYELDARTGRILVLAVEGPEPASEPFRVMVATGWLDELRARLLSAP